MVRISHDASILPVILGGDIGAYAIGREFHEAYGCKAISLIQEPCLLYTSDAADDIGPV